MESLTSTESAWRIGLFLIGATAVYTLLYRIPGKALFNKISSRGRKDSTAKTPPRSFSPDKKDPQSASSPPTYSHALPPSRRESMLQLKGATTPWCEVDEADMLKDMLPMTANYKTSSGKLYTPTGFSVDDIKSLGDFPNYAALSGVPLPSAYPEHDINKAIPRPYRPFRWAYHQTMCMYNLVLQEMWTKNLNIALMRMETDWWIELESTYKSRIAQRKELYAKYGKAVLDALPGSELACKELMEMVLQFVCTRYPQHFTLVDKRILKNHILGTEHDVQTRPPLEILLENIPEDFAIMLRDDETGFYYLRAAVICSALGWNVASKIGKRLDQIHAPIPDYKEKMQFSMDRYVPSFLARELLN